MAFLGGRSVVMVLFLMVPSMVIHLRFLLSPFRFSVE